MSLPQRRPSLSPSPALVLPPRQRPFNAAKRGGYITLAQTKRNEKQTAERTFFEDFFLDHSRSGPQVFSSEFAVFF